MGPRIDAIEEITVSTAASGAEATGGGATQIRYTTKSGTNELRGSVFHQYRSDALNTNTWFNKRDSLPKPELLQNQPGFNVGGPVVLPGFDGRNRAFFFVNYEELRSPSDDAAHPPDLPSGGDARQSSVTAPPVAAADGESVRAGRAQRPARHARSDHLETAGRHPQRDGVGRQRRDLADPLYQQYSSQRADRSMNRYPTVRLDYQLSGRHRVTWSMNYQYFGGGPDTTNNREAYFPGFPVEANQSSTAARPAAGCDRCSGRRWSTSSASATAARRCVFAEEQFTKNMWEGPVANQGGYYLNMAQSMGFTPTSRTT